MHAYSAPVDECKKVRTIVWSTKATNCRKKKRKFLLCPSVHLLWEMKLQNADSGFFFCSIFLLVWFILSRLWCVSLKLDSSPAAGGWCRFVRRLRRASTWGWWRGRRGTSWWSAASWCFVSGRGRCSCARFVVKSFMNTTHTPLSANHVIQFACVQLPPTVLN